MKMFNVIISVDSKGAFSVCDVARITLPLPLPTLPLLGGLTRCGNGDGGSGI